MPPRPTFGNIGKAVKALDGRKTIAGCVLIAAFFFIEKYAGVVIPDGAYTAIEPLVVIGIAHKILKWFGFLKFKEKS